MKIVREYHAYVHQAYEWGVYVVPGVVLVMADGSSWFHPETGAAPFRFYDAAVAGVRAG